VPLYEHCAMALDTSLTKGEHGLPLIGTGDWNDGMNSVGEKGRGESVWLGWFLLQTLEAFIPVAEARGDNVRVDRWREYSCSLRDALEQAWDGDWYRRGYYDDGAPLGSKDSDQCQIDTIAQSWSVIAHASDPEHTAQAMGSVDRKLVDHEHGIAKLFTPPFDQDGKENPGYIKGYPPGVRENGGQYTHGAIWSVFAWAGLGDGDRAGALFDLLNPIHHSDSAEATARYKVEPYVVSADVYSVDPHMGRGGWTWYTGSAAWLYRAGLEAILGFKLRGETLRIEPCIPGAWSGFQLTYQHHGKQHVSRYEISVKNSVKNGGGVVGVELDGKTLPPEDAVALVDDGNTHRLQVLLG
jgi:cellobiose phosphorylase